MALEKLHERPDSLERIRLIRFPIGREKATQNCWLHLNPRIRINLVRPRERIFLYWGHKIIEVIALAVSEVSFLVGLFAQPSTCHYFFFNFYLLFIYYVYFWLCWVFVSVRGLSPAAASGGHPSSRCAGLSLLRPLLLRSRGSRRSGSAVVAHGPSRSAACGILPDQGSNPCPRHWQADSQPLRHQGSPHVPLLIVKYQYSPAQYLGTWSDSPTPDSFRCHPRPSLGPRLGRSCLPSTSFPLVPPGSHSASWECGCLLIGRFLLPHHTSVMRRKERLKKNIERTKCSSLILFRATLLPPKSFIYLVPDSFQTSPGCGYRGRWRLRGQLPALREVKVGRMCYQQIMWHSNFNLNECFYVCCYKIHWLKFT